MRRPISFRLGDVVDDLPALLRTNELDNYFGTNDQGECLKPIRVSPKVCINWLSYAVNELARETGLGPPQITRIGTWYGTNLLRHLEIWPRLLDVFLERRRLAYEEADGRALKQMEAPINLDWRETSHRRFSIYVYVPTYSELRDASEVAALSVTQMVQAVLMIAVAETEGWDRHLGPELEEFLRHLNRRLLVLEGGSEVFFYTCVPLYR